MRNEKSIQLISIEMMRNLLEDSSNEKSFSVVKLIYKLGKHTLKTKRKYKLSNLELVEVFKYMKMWAEIAENLTKTK